MSEQWFGEPWEIQRSALYGHVGGGMGLVCDFDDTVPASPANRERIRACVNALAGVPNPEGIPAIVEAARYIAVCYSGDSILELNDALHVCGIEP